MAPIKKLIRKILPSSFSSGLADIFRYFRGIFWQARFGFPARGQKIIAVTGTNGKTTTISFINKVLKAGGYKTAVTTTAYKEIAGDYQPSPTTYTLQKQSELQTFLSRAKKAKVDWVIVEVTSHALHQRRIMGLKAEVAAITNLSQEHLDYHGTMEEYARVKSLLLRDYGVKTAVLNADDGHYEYFAGRSKAEVISFGKASKADLNLKDIKISDTGSEAKLVAKGYELAIKTNLLGEFNLYNASQAACVGKVLGIDSAKISEGILALKNVDGRMESVDEGQDFKVLIDYAVTPDALENVLKTLKKVAKGSVRIVFGATGDRDKTKRPIMGEVVAKNADYIYLTDDETYTEDPDTIRKAVFDGIKSAGGETKTQEIADRKKAIERAISDAKAGDIVLLTGMGHEDHRNMGGKLIPWQEAEIARELLRGLRTTTSD